MTYTYIILYEMSITKAHIACYCWPILIILIFKGVQVNLVLAALIPMEN